MIWAVHKNGSDLFACFDLPAPVEEAAFDPSLYLDAFNFKNVDASVILDETDDQSPTKQDEPSP